MAHPYDRIAEEPGGMECEECNVIFVGAEYHRICAVCAGINEPPPRIDGKRNPETGNFEVTNWPKPRVSNPDFLHQELASYEASLKRK